MRIPLRALAALAILIGGSAAFAACPPPPPPSWGCAAWNPSTGVNGSISHYDDDNTKMELNTDMFAPQPGDSVDICGNNQQFHTDMNATSCGGCVQAYPSIKYRFDQSSWLGCCAGPPNWIGGSVPINLMQSWTSGWDTTFDHSTNAEAGYDLWFRNNCGALGKTINGDMMIWPDTTTSRGTGGAPITGHYNLDGRQVTLMQYGTPGTDVSETIFKFDTNELSGTVNLKAFLYVEFLNGDLKSCGDSTGVMVGNADFGFEICQTTGTETFTVNNFGFDLQTTDGVHHS